MACLCAHITEEVAGTGVLKAARTVCTSDVITLRVINTGSDANAFRRSTLADC